MNAEDLRCSLLSAYTRAHDLTVRVVKLQTSANFMQKQLQIANRNKNELQEELAALTDKKPKHGSKTSTTIGANADEKLGLVMVGEDSADVGVQVQL